MYNHGCRSHVGEKVCLKCVHVCFRAYSKKDLMDDICMLNSIIFFEGTKTNVIWSKLSTPKFDSIYRDDWINSETFEYQYYFNYARIHIIKHGTNNIFPSTTLLPNKPTTFQNFRRRERPGIIFLPHWQFCWRSTVPSVQQLWIYNFTTLGTNKHLPTFIFLKLSVTHESTM